MMRRIVARVFGNDFRSRDYESMPQSAHSAMPALQLVAGSARHAYRAAKTKIRHRAITRHIGKAPAVFGTFCRRLTERCALGGYR